MDSTFLNLFGGSVPLCAPVSFLCLFPSSFSFPFSFFLFLLPFSFSFLFLFPLLFFLLFLFSSFFLFLLLFPLVFLFLSLFPSNSLAFLLYWTPVHSITSGWIAPREGRWNGSLFQSRLQGFESPRRAFSFSFLFPFLFPFPFPFLFPFLVLFPFPFSFSFPFPSSFPSPCHLLPFSFPFLLSFSFPFCSLVVVGLKERRTYALDIFRVGCRALCRMRLVRVWCATCWRSRTYERIAEFNLCLAWLPPFGCVGWWFEIQTAAEL